MDEYKKKRLIARGWKVGNTGCRIALCTDGDRFDLSPSKRFRRRDQEMPHDLADNV